MHGAVVAEFEGKGFFSPNTELQSRLGVNAHGSMCEPLLQWWCSAATRQAAESCKPRAGPLSAATSTLHLAVNCCPTRFCPCDLCSQARAFISLVASLLICFRAVSRPRPAAFVPYPCPPPLSLPLSLSLSLYLYLFPSVPAPQLGGWKRQPERRDVSVGSAFSAQGSPNNMHTGSFSTASPLLDSSSQTHWQGRRPHPCATSHTGIWVSLASLSLSLPRWLSFRSSLSGAGGFSKVGAHLVLCLSVLFFCHVASGFHSACPSFCPSSFPSLVSFFVLVLFLVSKLLPSFLPAHLLPSIPSLPPSFPSSGPRCVEAPESFAVCMFPCREIDSCKHTPNYPNPRLFPPAPECLLHPLALACTMGTLIAWMHQVSRSISLLYLAFLSLSLALIRITSRSASASLMGSRSVLR